ncbi:hypothetical protein PIB30_078199, partial [Stylosanthes scabra]|nr:hypothetical protein [Stylosanthes scabra]
RIASVRLKIERGPEGGLEACERRRNGGSGKTGVVDVCGRTAKLVVDGKRGTVSVSIGRVPSKQTSTVLQAETRGGDVGWPLKRRLQRREDDLDGRAKLTD